jgi:hypothetical protein
MAFEKASVFRVTPPPTTPKSVRFRVVGGNTGAATSGSGSSARAEKQKDPKRMAKTTTDTSSQLVLFISRIKGASIEDTFRGNRKKYEFRQITLNKMRGRAFYSRLRGVSQSISNQMEWPLDEDDVPS